MEKKVINKFVLPSCSVRLLEYTIKPENDEKVIFLEFYGKRFLRYSVKCENLQDGKRRFANAKNEFVADLNSIFEKVVANQKQG